MTASGSAPAKAGDASAVESRVAASAAPHRWNRLISASVRDTSFRTNRVRPVEDIDRYGENWRRLRETGE
jgi:hypothetical protein